MRILIVDDNERARTALKFLLGVRKDCEICGEASGGKQGILKAIQLNPDVIILDYSMPDVDGLHAAAEIHKALPIALIILCTLFYSVALEQEAMQYGVNRVIAKTDMSRSLLDTLDNISIEKNRVS